MLIRIFASFIALFIFGFQGLGATDSGYTEGDLGPDGFLEALDAGHGIWTIPIRTHKDTEYLLRALAERLKNPDYPKQKIEEWSRYIREEQSVRSLRRLGGIALLTSGGAFMASALAAASGSHFMSPALSEFFFVYSRLSLGLISLGLGSAFIANEVFQRSLALKTWATRAATAPLRWELARLWKKTVAKALEGTGLEVQAKLNRPLSRNDLARIANELLQDLDRIEQIVGIDPLILPQLQDLRANILRELSPLRNWTQKARLSATSKLTRIDALLKQYSPYFEHQVVATRKAEGRGIRDAPIPLGHDGDSEWLLHELYKSNYLPPSLFELDLAFRELKKPPRLSVQFESGGFAIPPSPEMRGRFKLKVRIFANIEGQSPIELDQTPIEFLTQETEWKDILKDSSWYQGFATSYESKVWRKLKQATSGDSQQCGRRLEELLNFSQTPERTLTHPMATL